MNEDAKYGDVDEGEEEILIISYEEDPVENYDTRLLAAGLALSFLFGLGVGVLWYLYGVEFFGV